MQKYKIKKIFLIILVIIFCSKLIYNFYVYFFTVPKEIIIEMQNKNNYILFLYQNKEEFLRNFNLNNPYEKTTSIKNNLLIEKYTIQNFNLEMDTLLKLKPKEADFKNNQNFTTIYFYKRISKVTGIFIVLYESIIWIFSLLFYIVVFFSIIVLLIYFLHLSKNLYKIIQNRKELKHFTN